MGDNSSTEAPQEVTPEQQAFIDALLGGGGGSTPKETFQVGADNTAYYNQSVVDPDVIIDNVGKVILQGLVNVGKNQGFSPVSMGQFWEGNWTPQGALGFIDGIFQKANRDAAGVSAVSDPDLEGYQGSEWYLTDPNGFESLVQKVWDWYNQKAPIDLGAYDQSVRGSGRGSSGMSEEDIRNQFDVNQLTELAQNRWRELLFEETDEARAYATAYVDAIVAGKGQVKIDFKQFITDKARGTARHASIYRNKVESMTEEQYMGRYFGAAQQVLRPDNAASAAIGGAQFGSDSATFAARLGRSSEATSSANYINQLQERLSGLGQVLRG